MKKSLATLIDELISTCLKCWFAQETVMNGKTDKEVAKAAKQAQQLNVRRNRLMRAIDEATGFAEDAPAEKTYGN
jgi:hypothetical protein